jgi:hypothetical protein
MSFSAGVSASVFQRQNIIRKAAKVTGPVVPGFFAERTADHSVSGVRVGEDLSPLRSSC